MLAAGTCFDREGREVVKAACLPVVVREFSRAVTPRPRCLFTLLPFLPNTTSRMASEPKFTSKADFKERWRYNGDPNMSIEHIVRELSPYMSVTYTIRKDLSRVDFVITTKAGVALKNVLDAFVHKDALKRGLRDQAQGEASSSSGRAHGNTKRARDTQRQGAAGHRRPRTAAAQGAAAAAGTAKRARRLHGSQDAEGDRGDSSRGQPGAPRVAAGGASDASGGSAAEIPFEPATAPGGAEHLAPVAQTGAAPAAPGSNLMEVVKHLQQELQEMHRKQGAEDVLKQQQEAAMRQLEGDYNQLQTKYEELKTERGGNSAGGLADDAASLRDLEQQLAHARTMASDLETELLGCKAAMARTGLQLAQLKADAAASHARIAMAEAETAQLRVELQGVRGDNSKLVAADTNSAELQAELDEQKAAAASKAAEALQQAEAHATELQAELDDQKAAAAAASAKAAEALQQAEARATELQAELDEQKAAAAAASAKAAAALQQADARATGLQAELAAQAEAAAALEHKVAEYRARVALVDRLMADVDKQGAKAGETLAAFMTAADAGLEAATHAEGQIRQLQQRIVERDEQIQQLQQKILEDQKVVREAYTICKDYIAMGVQVRNSVTAAAQTVPVRACSSGAGAGNEGGTLGGGGFRPLGSNSTYVYQPTIVPQQQAPAPVNNTPPTADEDEVINTLASLASLTSADKRRRR